MKQSFQYSYLSLVLTNECNYSCPFCCYGGHSEHLPKEDVFKIVKEAKEYGITGVCLTGGEPFLHPDIMEICDFLNKEKLSFSVVTNGSLVTKEILDHFIEDYKIPVHFTLSIDHYDREMNDKLRSPGSFDAAINCYKLIKNRCATNVKVIISPNNVKNLDRLTDFLVNDIGFNSVVYSIIIPMGRARGNKDLNLFEPHLKTVRRVEEIVQKYKAKSIRIGIIDNFQSPCVENCDVFGNSIAVFSDGNIVPCCLLIDPDYRYGTIKEGLAKALERAPAINEKIRKKILYNHDLLIAKNGIFTCIDCVNNQHNKSVFSKIKSKILSKQPSKTFKQ